MAENSKIEWTDHTFNGWVRSIRDQCAAAEVPFFFKQWGEWMPASHAWSFAADGDEIMSNLAEMSGKFKSAFSGSGASEDLFRNRESVMFRVGKNAAGRSIDCVEWSQFPEFTGVSK